MVNKNRVVQKNWHVVYTRSRAEKKVIEELTFNNIECFLPLQKKLRQWKDRKKWVDMPLMSGYCFVHITKKEYDKVLAVNNIVCYVTFEGKAAVVPDNQIDSLKQMLQQSDFEITVSHDNFKPGKKVEIIEGAMVGLQGELVEARGRNRFILRFSEINSAFTVEVPASQLSLLPL